MSISTALERARLDVVRAGHPADRAMRRWNGALDPRPAAVVRCASAEQVGVAFGIARDADVPVSIHNGGQDWAGRSLRDGSLVLDLSGLTNLSINPGRREATIGGGVTTGDLNQMAGEHGLVAVVGNDGATGVMGLTLGGGYGPLMTRFGLSCDNLLAAEVVLPDGGSVTCDATQNAELFWALRGGGGNFGVVTSARLRLHAPEQVLAATIVFPLSAAAAALERYADAMARAPAELFGAAILSSGPGGRPVAVFSLVWSGPPGRGEEVVAEFAAAGAPLAVHTATMAASALLSLTDGKLVPGRGYEVATRWFEALTPAAIDSLVSSFDGRSSPHSSVVIHHCHGAATSVASDATAFGMRTPHFTAIVYGAWEAADDPGPHRAWTQDLAARLDAVAMPGGYANLLPDNASGLVVGAFGSNGQRLARAKRRFDPRGMLRGVPLPPAEECGMARDKVAQVTAAPS